MPTLPAGGLLFRRLQLQLHGADADDGGDLIGERDVLAGGHGARGDEAIEGRANGGVGERLFGLGELRADAFERGLGVLHGAAALARAIERGFILLAGGIGLRVGGLLLRVRLFEGAAGDVAGGHQVLVALGVGGGLAGLAWADSMAARAAATSGTRGRIEGSLAVEADARLRLADAGGGLIERGAGLVEPKLGIAMIEFADHLSLFDEIADVDRRGDDASGHQRRDVAGFIGDEGAGLLEGGRNGAGDGLRGGDGDGLGASSAGGCDLVFAGTAGQQQRRDRKCEDDRSVHLLCPLSWLVCLNSVHDDVDKAIGHLAIARVRAEAEHLRHVGVVSGHAGDGRDDGAGIASAQSALSLSTRDVLAQELKDGERKLAIVLESGLVAFEGGEEEDAMAPLVAAMRIDDGFDDDADEAFVVVALHAGLALRDALGDVARVVVVIEHRII